jgi:protein TonB
MQIKYVLLSFLLLFAISVTAQEKEQPKKEPVIYTYVEKMPTTGYEFNKYLAENIHYPDTARMNNIQGRVIVKFVVNEDGSISDCTIIKGIGGGCDEEALRVAKNMPAWKNPGTQNGVPVKVYYSLPIVFKLTDK